MPPRAARIACLDLDCFFVSVERLLDPSLVGRPVVVGATGWHGVVTSASYEVRALGVKAGMPIAEARRKAPHAIYLPVRHGLYGERSADVRAVLDRFTPDVQAASIDEFFLDLRGTERLWARPGDADADATVVRVVRELREAVQRETGLPSSVGLAVTRPLAKIASGLAKPAGVRVVPAGAERAFVAGMPVRKWPGIGEKTEERLLSAGVDTLDALLALGDGHRFARLSAAVREGCDGAPRALGADRPAFHEHDPEHVEDGREHTLSNERTFFAGIGDRDGVMAQLRSLAERVCHRARRRGVSARTVTLKLRTVDFVTVTRSRTLPAPTNHEPELLGVLGALLDAAWSRDRAVRLVGVGLSGLDREALPTGATLAAGESVQLALPLGRTPLRAAVRPAMGKALDAVRERFGYDAVRLGVSARPGAPDPEARRT